MEQKFISMLIADYDQLLKLPIEAYELVIPHLNQVSLKRNSVLKKSGKVDFASRYLCKGFLGIYHPIKDRMDLMSIFKPSDTVFDEYSYRTGIKSEVVIKSISEVIFLEFSVEAENLLLSKHPEFSLLAHRVAHRVSERKSKVHAISKMGLEEGYPVLMNEFQGLEAEITNSDLASFFGVHTRTVERWKHGLRDR